LDRINKLTSLLCGIVVVMGLVSPVAALAATPSPFAMRLAPACVKPAATDDSISFVLVNEGTDDITVEVHPDNAELFSAVDRFPLAAGHRETITIYIEARQTNTHVTFLALGKQTASGVTINRGLAASVIFHGQECAIAPTGTRQAARNGLNVPWIPLAALVAVGLLVILSRRIRIQWR
jgi:hypothetical protein